jgi:hypothetical protein
MKSPFPVEIAHETHRSWPTYSLWSTNTLLNHFPEFKLMADFNHLVLCLRIAVRRYTGSNGIADLVNHSYSCTCGVRKGTTGS